MSFFDTAYDRVIAVLFVSFFLSFFLILSFQLSFVPSFLVRSTQKTKSFCCVSVCALLVVSSVVSVIVTNGSLERELCVRS